MDIKLVLWPYGRVCGVFGSVEGLLSRVVKVQGRVVWVHILCYCVWMCA